MNDVPGLPQPFCVLQNSAPEAKNRMKEDHLLAVWHRPRN